MTLAFQPKREECTSGVDERMAPRVTGLRKEREQILNTLSNFHSMSFQLKYLEGLDYTFFRYSTRYWNSLINKICSISVLFNWIA
jgi:hypothetical protein